MDVPALADKLYDQCLQAPAGRLFDPNELQALVPGLDDMQTTQEVINQLLNSRRLTAMYQGNKPMFKAVSKDYLDKVNNMTSDETILYGYIEEAAREGIWTKTLKAKSNMHATSMTKALKGLEAKKYVKAIKNVKYPTRKIYMLYELDPSSDVSGGPWFTDQELDKEFILELTTQINKFIISKSFPPRTSRGAPVASFPPGYTGYPTLTQIATWVKKNNLTVGTNLAEADIKTLLDVLVYDGKVERVVGGTAYKAVRKPDTVNGFTESPCGKCPVFNLCAEGGPVSASNCKYFEEWLNIGLD